MQALRQTNETPTRFARDFDIGDSIQCLRYYAGWADKIVGQVSLALTVWTPLSLSLLRTLDGRGRQ